MDLARHRPAPGYRARHDLATTPRRRLRAGAHALKKRLDAELLTVFETGARYHMYGALAVMALALAGAHGLRTTTPGWVMVAGTAVFAGTLYALALSGAKWWGAITPIGGTLMLVALAWAAVASLR